jgi:hypothetical protein
MYIRGFCGHQRRRRVYESTDGPAYLALKWCLDGTTMSRSRPFLNGHEAKLWLPVLVLFGAIGLLFIQWDWAFIDRHRPTPPPATAPVNLRQ